ncbi:hypothetical protein GCM10023086_73510 [Streptomyces venetus]|uniref:Uncharacterized protein n=1 Tax=Streptomyces venetus TaxID=1701086 RepID=A0ABP8HH15_9ACTN
MGLLDDGLVLKHQNDGSVQRHRRQRLEARVEYQRVPHTSPPPVCTGPPPGGLGSTLAGHAEMDNAISAAPTGGDPRAPGNKNARS